VADAILLLIIIISIDVNSITTVLDSTVKCCAQLIGHDGRLHIGADGVS